MIQTSNLTYKYPASAPIVFPDIKVEAGQALLIFGESGCGKTTLLHLLAGLKRLDAGQIFIDENEISQLPPARMDKYRGQNIGIVYQKPYFIESLSVWENLCISPYANDKRKAKEIADRLHISDLLDRQPNQLSAGQQQRAAIARAIMNTPKLLLADEPTSALDNKNCTHVIDLLMEQAKANNAALIITTHDNRLRSEINDYIELTATTN